MNSMPETTKSSEQINDSIVEAAITALAPFHPESAQQAADMLLFWARRAELTAADITEVGERLFPSTRPADDGGFAERFLEERRAYAEDLAARRRDDCPDWCTYDHRTDDGLVDDVLHTGDDHTDGSVRKLLDPHRLDLRVARVDQPAGRTVGKPILYVQAELELTTWEQAAELARTILDSFGYLKGADQP